MNFDSFTEIDEKIAEKYWRKSFERAGKFLSVNHEVNKFRVFDLYSGDNAYLVERHPYWMRRGYVEEVISLAK